jgi:hypothetical protein
VDETSDVTGRGDPPDLAILLEALAAVVGEVSKVYQAIKRAVDSGEATDYRRALGAFDGLPAWQKERILRVAVARAAEVTGPDASEALDNPITSSAGQRPMPEYEDRP